MKKFGQIMVMALGFGLLTIALSSITSKPVAAEKVDPVLVTNTTAQAVPVRYATTPTVNVGTIPAISGSVSVSNFPSIQNVSLSNTSATPLFVDADSPARNSFTQTCHITNHLGESFAECGAVDHFVPFPISPNIAVVTGFTGEFTVPTGTVVEAVRLCWDGSNCTSSAGTFFNIIPVKIGNDGTLDHYSASLTSGPLFLPSARGTAIVSVLTNINPGSAVGGEIHA